LTDKTFIDFEGHYTTLGVQSNATLAVIKAVYRVRMMEVHPDRNQSPGSSEEAKRINRAYEVLGDESARAAYDRACRERAEASAESRQRSDGDATRSTSSTQAPAKEQEGSRFEPIRCSVCKATTVRPRFREFITVFSFLVSSHKSTRSGVFCGSCEKKAALKASAITMLFGWWSIHGFFWTLDGLIKNVAAAWRHARQNALLACQQALYFFSIDKFDLAHAIALDALDEVSRVKGPKGEQKRRRDLGYDDGGDLITKMREAMTSIVAETEKAGQTLELARKSPWRDPAFVVQASVIGALVLVVTGSILVSVEQGRQREAERARAEQARLEREGIERAQAAAVVRQQAEELARLRLPLPGTGIFKSYGMSLATYRDEDLPRLSVVAPAGASYLIKLYRSNSMKPAFAVFVRAGESVEVRVPFGTYSVRMASGQQWYGEAMRFGPTTAYSQIDQPLDFSVEGDQLKGHALTLERVRNGNLKPSTISPDAF